MKRIFIVIFAVFIGSAVFFIFSGKNTALPNKAKASEIRRLLTKPKADESQYNYVILNDFSDSGRKKSHSIDFISRIYEDKNKVNPYNTSYIRTAVTSNGKDLMLLARLIESEAENQSYAGKLAVASVVINRCRINGNTVRATVYASGQFDGINTTQFNRKPSNEDIRAASAALKGENIVPDAYYYANLKLCDPDFAKESKFSVRIGDHWFFKR